MRYLGSIIWVLAIVAATFALHEAAHGLATAALGHDAFIRVNSSGLVGSEVLTPLVENLTSAAGPLLTIIQGFLGAILIIGWGWRRGFVVVAAALLMRLLAAVASLRLPNDEARLGLSWGIGYWTVHLIVISVLLVLTIWAARRTRQSFGGVTATVVTITIAMIGVVVAEPYLPTLYVAAV